MKMWCQLRIIDEVGCLLPQRTIGNIKEPVFILIQYRYNSDIELHAKSISVSASTLLSNLWVPTLMTPDPMLPQHLKSS